MIANYIHKYYLDIDSEEWIYITTNFQAQHQIQTKLTQYSGNTSLYKQFILPLFLKMDEANPTKTIQTFHKLLMLQ